ncbi:hypothetical protein ABKN59_008337 [Abortiporus biennis]
MLQFCRMPTTGFSAIRSQCENVSSTTPDWLRMIGLWRVRRCLELGNNVHSDLPRLNSSSFTAQRTMSAGLKLLTSRKFRVYHSGLEVTKKFYHVLEAMQTGLKKMALKSRINAIIPALSYTTNYPRETCQSCAHTYICCDAC